MIKKRKTLPIKKICVLLLMIIYLLFLTIQNNSKEGQIQHPNKIEFQNPIKNEFQYYCCFVGIARKENLYVRELISYYLKIGVEKFIFFDNNLPNTEKLSDVIKDYVDKNVVDIIEGFGRSFLHAELFGEIYAKYKYKCEWLTFFDFDEYLIMKFNNGKPLTFKEYLSNPLFENCEAIGFNWLIYDDNGYIYYDNRTSMERFTNPNYGDYANKFIKSIVRGNLTKKIFLPRTTNHHPGRKVRTCDTFGKPIYHGDVNYRKNYGNGYIAHFNTRTAEEYVEKIKRWCQTVPANLEERIDLFFQHNKFTEEKLKFFEKAYDRKFPNLHKG